MNEELMVAQGTISNQTAAEALQTITGGIHYAGGNALLAAEVEAGAEIDNPEINQITETKLPVIKPRITQARQSSLQLLETAP